MTGGSTSTPSPTYRRSQISKVNWRARHGNHPRNLNRQQERTGGADGKGLRDLHQNDPGAPLEGDHRPRDEEQVQLRSSDPVRLEARLALPVEPPGWGRSLGGGRERRGRAAPP